MVTLHQAERGELNVLLFPLLIASLLLVGALGFGGWAYNSRQDFKTNSDSKSADAVAVAIKQEDAKKAAEFAEISKSPLKTYNGPAAYGSVQVQYPKSWSAYVVEQNSGTSVDGYFNPNYVPSTTGNANTFALRVRIVSQSYASVLQSFQGQIKSQKTTATPFAFAKVPDVIGTRLGGQISPNVQGSMVLVPLRANTLEVWTEGTTGAADFDRYVLPNLLFSP